MSENFDYYDNYQADKTFLPYVIDHGDLEVPVNLETARLLHQCVRTSLQDDRFQKYKQMKAGKRVHRSTQLYSHHKYKTNDQKLIESEPK